MKLDILYNDDYYVAVNKPSGLLVHRTKIAKDKNCLLQTLRDQIGAWIYPVHRLDRPTSGVIIFAKSPEAAKFIKDSFSEHETEKKYLAVVRGFTEMAAIITIPLRKEGSDRYQETLTKYQRLNTIEIPFATGKYQTARYSLVEVILHTGRMHQIRRHFKHIAHPVIGDTTHGDRHHNALFRERFGVSRLLLNAHKLTFLHPYANVIITIEAALDQDFLTIIDNFGWQNSF